MLVFGVHPSKMVECPLERGHLKGKWIIFQSHQLSVGISWFSGGVSIHDNMEPKIPLFKLMSFLFSVSLCNETLLFRGFVGKWSNIGRWSWYLMMIFEKKCPCHHVPIFHVTFWVANWHPCNMLPNMLLTPLATDGCIDCICFGIFCNHYNTVP